MDYPTNLPVDAASVNISDGEFSPFYDIVWSIKYEIVNWDGADEYGLCFFLQDSSVPIEGGGRGIDLGYSGTSTSVPGFSYARGMTGGVIGIGLDTRGMFAANTVWPGGATRSGLNDVDLLPNSITVRGGAADNYAFVQTNGIGAFNLLSDGVKILRARLGNYGRTLYLDYRGAGDTDFVNILTKDVDLDISMGDRLTPGVSFVKPLASITQLNIKVDTFHVEGKDDEPVVSQEYPEPLEPLDCTTQFIGNTIDPAPTGDIVTSDIPTLVMCSPPNPGDIIVSKVVTSTGPYELGDTIDYKIVVTSDGEYPLQNVTLTDTIPASRRQNTVDSYGLFTGNKVLAPGQSEEVTYSITVGISDGFSITNTAKVTTGIGVQGESTVTVQTVAAKDLIITKELLSTGPYEIGQDILYKIVVSNPNTVPITNIQLTDTLQPNITVTSDVDGLFAGNVTIANGASAEAQYTYTIVDTSTVNNVACVDSEIGTFCSTSIATPITPRKKLTITKEVTSTGPYEQGAAIQYRVSVTNPNFAEQGGVILTDTQSSEITNIVDANGLFAGTTIPGNTTYTTTYDYVIPNNNGADVVNTARTSYAGEVITASVTVPTKISVCIYLSFCDESSSSSRSAHESGFDTFRIKNPKSPFFILQQNDQNLSDLKLPTNFTADSDASVVRITKNKTENWFNMLGLDKYGPNSEVYFAVDDSGSFTRAMLGNSKHGGSWSQFQTDISTAFGTNVNDLGNFTSIENWIKNFEGQRCEIDITIP
jgi:uncharacterized repeat protein (TIGR01451 family)